MEECGDDECLLCPQSGKAAEKSQSRPCDVEVYEKKIKLLEKQRKDVSLLFVLLWLRVLLRREVSDPFPSCWFVCRFWR